MKVAQLFWLFAMAVGALGVSTGCSGGARTATNNNSSEPAAAVVPNDIYPTSGPSFDGSVLQQDEPQTWADIVRRSNVIALVEPTGQLPDLWSAQDTIVTSRYEARIVRVIKGDLKTGEIITLHANGGTMAANFAATSSQRPVAGEPTRVVEYVDSPFYHLGTPELVFLKKVVSDDPAIGTIYWADGPGARYNVVNRRLQSIFPPGVAASISDGAAIREAVNGLTPDQLAERVVAARG